MNASRIRVSVNFLLAYFRYREKLHLEILVFFYQSDWRKFEVNEKQYKLRKHIEYGKLLNCLKIFQS